MHSRIRTLVSKLSGAPSAAPTAIFGIFLAAALVGCEAPLDLSGVEAQRSEPVQRADLFQAAVRYQDEIVVVGAMGVVVHSADGGTSWQRQILPGKPFLLGAAVCPDGRVHAVDKSDGVWARGSDGGWSRHDLPEMTEPQAITCDPAGGLWVTGGFSTILHSTDGAANWDSWSLDEDLFLTTIQFVDQQHGFATGEFGTVLVTEDGGASWEPGAELPDSFYPQSAWFASPTEGWVIGLDGMIWRTDSAGASWEPSASGVNTPLYGIAGSVNARVAVGDNTTVLYQSAVDGPWQPLDATAQARAYLRAVTPLDGDSFVVAGGGTLFIVDVPETSSDKPALARAESVP